MHQLISILQLPKMNQFQSTSMLSATIAFLYYHLLSLIIIFFVILIILIDKKGTKQNQRIAQQGLKLIDPLLKQKFTNYSGQLVQQSSNIIKFYASGRDSCVFCIFAFALVPRQQIVSFLLNPLFFRLKDELVVQIPIKTNSPLPLTLAIVRRKNIRQITKKRYPDIKSLCKQYKPTSKQAFNVPQTHCILVQKKQHVNYLISTHQQVQLWKQYGKLVKMVYLSDHNKFSRYPMALRMVMNISQDMNPLLVWMLNFVDKMSKLKMGVGQKKQARKRRQDAGINFDQQ